MIEYQELDEGCLYLFDKEKLNRSFSYIESIILKTVFLKDKDTYLHCLRVREYAIKLGGVVGLSSFNKFILEKASILHDIGKIIVPISFIKKPGKLSAIEWDEVKKHPLYGQELLFHHEEVKYTRLIGEIIRHHHEYFNGKGYPDGLVKEEIPFLSRIISVADVFDALTSDRPYRNAFSMDKAVRMMQGFKGEQLDPYLTDIFIMGVINYKKLKGK